ncbi:MAG: glucose-6-phosphate 1-epimerase [Rubritalea sp.]|jgi:glucose-6-phosphate 1-epimerase
MSDLALTPAYEIDDHVWTELLAPSYPIIHLSNNHGTAAVALHGAHVISYTPAHQKPVIFTSQQAIYREGKAIRGGIPICWPWFNAHPSDQSLPSHGHARNQFWQVIGSKHTQDLTSVTLEINHNKLKASVTVSLGASLEISLTTTNISEKTQTIGGALHSYLSISDIEKISIAGLEDTYYVDTLTETEELQEGEISIHEEVDRIYINTSNTVSIYDPEWNRTIFVDKNGSQSTVIWNPWIEKSNNMADLGDDEYREFVCIEAANARDDVYNLEPGVSHTLSTTITSV